MSQIDPSKKPGWVRVLPELPVNFRFRNNSEPATSCRRGLPPLFSPRVPPQPATPSRRGLAPLFSPQVSPQSSTPSRREIPPLFSPQVPPQSATPSRSGIPPLFSPQVPPQSSTPSRRLPPPLFSLQVSPQSATPSRSGIPPLFSPQVPLQSATPSRRGLHPLFSPRHPTQPAPVNMSFGQAPICDSECSDCKISDNADRPKRGGKTPIAPKPAWLQNKKPAAVGDSDSNKQLGKSPMRKVRPPISPTPSGLGRPAPPLANILPPPIPSQPGVWRPPTPKQFATNVPRAPATPRSSAFPEPPTPRPPTSPAPLPGHPGLYRVPFSPHTPPRNEEAFDAYMQGRGRSQGDGETSFMKSRNRQNAISDGCMRQLRPTLGNDNYFCTDKIHNVTSSASFEELTKSMEKAFVMFYDPCSDSSVCVGREFAKAAETPHPNNHGFLGVDCSRNQDLCDQENAIKLPMFKLYSNGFDVSTIRNLRTFCTPQIHMLMKMAPVLTQSRVSMGAAIRSP